MRAVWDSEKELANIRKHGVDFVEAATVFNDPDVRWLPDLAHSTVAEERTVATGYTDRDRLLVVVTTEVDPDTVRIISARRATKRERHDHDEA